MKILIVDDDKTALRTLSKILESLGGHQLFLAQNLSEAIEILDNQLIEVAFVDLQLSPDIRNRDGLTLIQEIRAKHRATPIVVSGHAQSVDLREALRCGARNYIFKSEIDEDMISSLLNEQDQRLQLERDLLDMRTRSLPESPAMGLIGDSPAMERLRAMIRKVALSPNTDAVLIVGPTGSGKELVAQAIHALGKYARDPCFALNCSAFQKDLFETELFGNTPDAYTGARPRDGALKSVKQGTLFLDEIAEMPQVLQPKLLRALEARSYRPVGSDKESKFEGRIIAATHADLRQRVANGTFREDLWHRLNHLILRVPSLEERREDIPALLDYFIQKDARDIKFSPVAVELLCQRSWPGNVRELRHLLARLALESGVITPEVITRILAEREPPPPPPSSPSPPADSGANAAGVLIRAARIVLDLPGTDADGAPIDKLQTMGDALFTEALLRTGGHQARAAEILGVHRRVVGRWVEKTKKGVSQ